MKHIRPNVVLVAFVAVLMSAGFAAAATASFSVINVGSAGWTARFDNANVPAGTSYIALSDTSASGSTGPVFLNKSAFFNEAPRSDGSFREAAIQFSAPTGASATTFVIDFENIFNSTGTVWNGFRFLLEGDAHFAAVPSAGFGTTDSDDPFMTGVFSSSVSDPANPDRYALSNGLVPFQPLGFNIWTPGEEGANLVIVANGAFVLKEQPLSVGPGGGPVIPLPAAVWPGLSGLGGLALLLTGRKIRRLAI